MEKFHIAIDGPAGSGKTTVSKLLAKTLGFDYLDTGAMYRAIALFLDELGIPPDDVERIDEVLSKVKMGYKDGKLYLNGKEVNDEKIRTARAGILASDYAKVPVVRKHLTRLQREIANGRKMVVEGRDIGTVVLPDADLKIFLTASVEERARRRWRELREKGENISYEEVLEQLRKRDEQDSKRNVAPLKPADDAIVLDTTNLSVEEVVEKISNLVGEKNEMKVVLSNDYGFCFGVKNAVETLLNELKNKKVHTDGDIVHNRKVMEMLKDKGLEIVQDGFGEAFAVRAHGIPPDKLKDVSKRYERVIDLTCPIVKSLFEKARMCRDEGYGIVVFGKEGHAEMRALKGYVPSAVVSNEARFYGMERICVLAQTTSSWMEFSEFISKMIMYNYQAKEIKIVNTVCPVTVNREEEVKRLSKDCDVIIVVGGKHSANTGKLYRIASRNTKAYWIESPSEVEKIDLKGMRCIAIVSGTSTPAEDVEEVFKKISGRDNDG
jgi:(E)-4-hydroxy-3-methyl-but-2-enyl pyrophosphate reductase/cytidylate kinase